MDTFAFQLATAVYGLQGLVMGLVMFRLKELRETPLAQLIVTISIFLGGGVVLLTSSHHQGLGAILYASTEGFLFLTAALCHLPVVVYVAIFQWNRMLEQMTSPGRREKPPCRPRTLRQEWQEIQTHLETLGKTPLAVSPRRQLADIYLRLGMVDSAIGELRKAIDCLDKSYEQAYLLFKTCHILVDVKNDIPGALPLLRRTMRLYPKSYFAAYAKRVINHYESRTLSGSR